MAKDFFKQFSNEFAELEKGDLKTLADGNEYHFDLVRFIKGENGDYVQFTLIEKPGFFFNGSNPITENLLVIKEADMLDELSEIAWKFKVGKSSQWNTEYVAMNAIL